MSQCPTPGRPPIARCPRHWVRLGQVGGVLRTPPVAPPPRRPHRDRWQSKPPGSAGAPEVAAITVARSTQACHGHRLAKNPKHYGRSAPSRQLLRSRYSSRNVLSQAEVVLEIVTSGSAVRGVCDRAGGFVGFVVLACLGPVRLRVGLLEFDIDWPIVPPLGRNAVSSRRHGCNGRQVGGRCGERRSGKFHTAHEQ